MKFKTDENLPVDVLELMLRQQHDAIGAVDQGLGGCTDDNLASACKSEERALMTLDLDFSDIRRFPPCEYFGIVVLRPVSHGKNAVLKLVQKTLDLLTTEALEGRLWIVSDGQIRIRS